MASNFYYSPNSLTTPYVYNGDYADYFGNHTPPHVNAAYSNILTDLLLSKKKDDVFQMQQQQQQNHHYLKYPTPPNTPPKLMTIVPPMILQQQVEQTNQQQQRQLRTQSVIMKTMSGCSPQNVPTDVLEDDTMKCVQQEATSSDASFANTEYICDWLNCGRYFESLELMAAHVTQLHAIASLNDGQYYCRWRGCTRSERGFNARYKMLVHVRTHTKEKPHQCHLCEKCFSRAENLKIHIRSHSGEKPYVCTFPGCDKAYSNSSDRFKHTRTHSMEKPYMCKISGCQKRYTDPSSLRKHVKTFKHTEQLIDETAVNAITSTTSNQRRTVAFSAVSTTTTNIANAATKVMAHKSTTTTTTTTPPQQPLQPPPPTTTTAATCSCMTTAMPSAAAQHYFMDLGWRNVDVGHLKAQHFMSPHATATGYWIVNGDEHTNKIVDAVDVLDYSKNFRLHEKVALVNDDFALDMEIETPLDLSVKRS